MPSATAGRTSKSRICSSEVYSPTPDAPTEPPFPDEGIDFEQYQFSNIELSLIKKSLERTNGNKRQAAKLLNLKRTTLIEKLKRLNGGSEINRSQN